jgi:prolyl 4-hydroxylase
MTFLIYLNDLEPDEPGGSTSFPALGLDVRPQKNAALVFENYDVHGNEDVRTLHGGEPPRLSDKYVINVWIRTAPFAAFAGADAQVLRNLHAHH